MFLLKIQRDFCHPKSFGTFEKRAPGPLILALTRAWYTTHFFLPVRFARLIYFSRDQLSSMVINFLDSKHARVNSRVTELDLKLDSRNFGGSSRVDFNLPVHLFWNLHPSSQNESICQTFLQWMDALSEFSHKNLLESFKTEIEINFHWVQKPLLYWR